MEKKFDIYQLIDGSGSRGKTRIHSPEISFYNTTMRRGIYKEEWLVVKNIV